MTCSEFVEGFTDFLDGEGSEELRSAAEAHMESCAGCRRYHQVVVRGAAVLRALPEATVSEDFEPRLQHRLYHVDDEAALGAHTSSGATVLTVVGMSMLLTVLAWSPTLRPTAPVVEMPPIVVSEPPPRLRPVNALPVRPGILRPTWAGRSTDLWDDAQALLYEYSPLQQRYRQRTPFSRQGLD